MKDSSARSSFSNLFTTIITTVIGLVVGIIITRQLGPELKGQYSALLLLTSFYGPLLLFGYANGVLYYGLKRILPVRDFFWTGFIVVSALSILIDLVSWNAMQAGLLGDIILHVGLKIKALILVLLPLTILNGYMEKVLRSESLFRLSNKRLIIASLFLLALYSLVLLIKVELTLEIALIGLILSNFLQLVLNFYFLIPNLKVKSRLGLALWSKPWKYGLQVWLNQLIAKSNDRFDQLLLTYLLTPSNFGLYVVGVSLSNLVGSIPNSYISVFFNRVIEKEEDKRVGFYAIIQRFTFTLTALGAVAIGIVSFWLIPLVYGSDFAESAWVVLLYAPGLVFQIAARVNSKLFASIGKPLKNSLIYLFGIGVSLPFYFFLIPIYGILGAAISSSITYFSAYMFSHYQVWREFGVPIQKVIIFQISDLQFWRNQLANIKQ